MTTADPKATPVQLPPTPSEVARWSVADVLVLVGLALVVIYAHGPALSGGFLSWDDDTMVVRNDGLNPPKLSALAWRWVDSYEGLYTPVPHTLWYAASVVGGGPRAWVFHAVSFLLHGLTVLFTYAALRQMPVRWWAAAAGALVVAAHPLTVEAVGWISGIEDVSCGAAVAAAVWLWVGFHRGDPNQKPVYFWMTVLMLGVAMLCKPQAAAVPIALALMSWLVFGYPWRQVLLQLIPMLMVVAPLAVVAKAIQPGLTPAQAIAEGGSGEPVPWWARPIIAADSAGFYVQKFLWPNPLGIDYGRTPQSVVAGLTGSAQTVAARVPAAAANLAAADELAATENFAATEGFAWPDGFAWPGLLILAVVAAAAYTNRGRPPAVMILAAAVTVLPVSGLVGFNFQVYSTVADRYTYLGLIFVSIGAGLMLEQASRARLLYLVVLLVAAGAWMVLARQQSRTYLSNEALYRRAIDTNPRSWMSLNNLAFHRLQADDPRAAFELAQQAVAISPDYGNGLLTLGLALEKMGAFEQAVGPLERGVAILHDQALGRSVLGRVYAQLWRLDDAERELTLALKLDPSLAGAKAMLEKVREVRASTRPAAP